MRISLGLPLLISMIFCLESNAQFNAIVPKSSISTAQEFKSIIAKPWSDLSAAEKNTFAIHVSNKFQEKNLKIL